VDRRGAEGPVAGEVETGEVDCDVAERGDRPGRGRDVEDVLRCGLADVDVDRVEREVDYSVERTRDRRGVDVGGEGGGGHGRVGVERRDDVCAVEGDRGRADVEQLVGDGDLAGAVQM